MVRPSTVSTLSVAIVAALLPQDLALGTDLTRTPGATGSSVVETVCLMIQESGIFPYDHRFLRRLAYVETKDGSLLDRTVGNHRGIWHVDQSAFNATQNFSRPELIETIDRINVVFKINWSLVEWHDLDKPIHSALAARLHLANTGLPIPATLQEQGLFWQFQNFPAIRNRSSQTFISDTTALESQKQCRETLVYFLLDASGSIGQPDYHSAQEFIDRSMVTLLNHDRARVGLLYFGTKPYVSFQLTSSAATARSYMSGMPHLGYDTQIGRAIDLVVDKFGLWESDAKVRSRLCVVLTDGDSADDVTASVRRASDAGIAVVTVRIGHVVAEKGLLAIAQGQAEYVLSPGSSAVSMIKDVVQQVACELPVHTSNGQTVKRSLAKDEATFLSVEVSTAGASVTITSSSGAVRAYAAYEFRHPGEAFHTVLLADGETTYVPPFMVPNMTNSSNSTPPPSIPTASTLYLGLKGSQTQNTFTIIVVDGGGPKAELKPVRTNGVTASSNTEKPIVIPLLLIGVIFQVFYVYF